MSTASAPLAGAALDLAVATGAAGSPLAGAALGLAAALGGGLLIGLERERRKRRGPQREAAGIRSFALAALGGGVAQVLGQPTLVALGGFVVAMLVGVAYWKSREPRPGRPDGDPGLTTELALFITYLVGVLSVQAPVLGAGAAAVVAGLLAARERLHHFATRLLSDAELHDALLLAALALVLLPLAPAAPLAWLGGMALRTLLLLVLLILAQQAVGHVALRLLGPRAGLALSGLFSGFVSSTATIASMGSRARAQPALGTACEAAALLSTVATWMQAMLMLAALTPASALALAPSAAIAAAVAAAAGWLRLRQAPKEVPASDGHTGRSPPAAGPLRLREALLVAALLLLVAVAVSWAQRHFGSAGLLGGTALAALGDAHAPVAALGALAASGQIDAATVRDGALVAIGANSVTRCITAFVAGGAGYGSRVALSLAASTGAAVALALVLR